MYIYVTMFVMHKYKLYLFVRHGVGLIMLIGEGWCLPTPENTEVKEHHAWGSAWNKPNQLTIESGKWTLCSDCLDDHRTAHKWWVATVILIFHIFLTIVYAFKLQTAYNLSHWQKVACLTISKNASHHNWRYFHQVIPFNNHLSNHHIYDELCPSTTFSIVLFGPRPVRKWAGTEQKELVQVGDQFRNGYFRVEALLI